MIHDQNLILHALLRQDLSSFIQKGFDIVTGGEPYHHNWHIDLIASNLEACVRGEIRRLVITIPPRNLKSICASVAFPAWILGHDPRKKVIAVSYAQDLALKHAQDFRAIVDSEIYRQIFPGTRPSSYRNTQSEYITTRGGGRLSTSTGGTLTGRGGDILIIDDPLKPQDAMSETARAGVNNWYDNTLYSRLNDKKNGCIVIIMQRLHEDDLVGHVLRQEGWVHVNLPALAEHDEVHVIKTPNLSTRTIRRRAGEALHPEREAAEDLEKLRTEILGAYHFSAQYQQSPAPSGGGLIKWGWLRPYPFFPDEKPLRIVQSWDTASKAEEIHDFSVCTTWHEYKHGWYLVDLFRQRLEFPDLLREVRRQAEIYGPNAILIEDKGSGTQIIQELRQSSKLVIYSILPEGDKITRAVGQTPKMETGKVFIPQAASWLSDLENEIIRFPKGAHDDQIDSISQALEWMSKSAWLIQPDLFPKLSTKKTTIAPGMDEIVW